MSAATTTKSYDDMSLEELEVIANAEFQQQLDEWSKDYIDQAVAFFKAKDAEPASLGKQLTDRAAHQAATSYLNTKPQPTEDQKSAGNYPKGHVNIAGMDVSIENPAGSHRRPEWPTLTSHYGYIRRTMGADGDHVDAFVRNGTPENYSGDVHVINQNIDGSFDEHKVMIGWEKPEDARVSYLSNYERGWNGIGSMVTLPMEKFKDWLSNGDTTKPLQNTSMLSRLLNSVRRVA